MVTESNQIQPKPAQIHRRITWQDAEAIAELVAKRLTETEAAYSLDIEPRRWFIFKQRNGNQPKFDALVQRMRGMKIKHVLEDIENAGEPFTYTANGKEYQKPGDWRAKAWIAERALAPDRYGQSQQQQTTNNTLVLGDAAAQAIIDKVFNGITDKPKAQVDCPSQPSEPKQLNTHNL